MVRGRTAIEAEVRVWRWMRSRSVKKIQDWDHEVELIGDGRGDVDPERGLAGLESFVVFA